MGGDATQRQRAWRGGRASSAAAACGRRSGWKKRRDAGRSAFALRHRGVVCSVQLRGGCENLSWVLPALKIKGYAILKLPTKDLPALQSLYQHSREFFQRPNKYKETFKCFPIPGGYLTPYPGTHEIFELRRGLPRCPSELLQAMPAFALLERISCAVCTEVGRDLGIDLAQMPCETSSTMRCIHYDRPLESRGDGDLQAPARAPAIGTHVRLVGLQGAEASLNGLKGCVTDADADTAVVSLSGAPEAVLHQRASETVTVQLGHLRVLWSQAPGMYPAHTDSSLVTLAPRSSAPGLEVKDLQTGEWFNVEEALLPDDCLLFVGDPLDYASAHQYPALMHRPAVCGQSKGGGSGEHRISTPFFLYPRAEAVLAPQKLPRLVFDDLNGNVNGCRDRFPWKKHTCYYSDLVYSESKD